MKLAFTPQGWEDYVHWQTADRKILKRINRLIDDTLRDPYEGIGKPEPLKHALAGAWSRRITDEHRLVYLPRDAEVIVLQARYQYE
ncbi:MULTISPECIES: Txe/YoeB family addiction module toxin [Streptomyces]|uniref:Endoribonuclease YoeB n=1 Tax=Streptomyces dengpaensis TaxID=2049881 RepID=A0ABM6SQ43_9ACTN|nr:MULTISPECIES: Txe/YoeB family addiction module toxin [Streptomyces]AVH56775.1 Txe/YoeB family addiction module toxin [Streptomyces dengpaensis]PIB10195.1 toxin RelK [Streptomyces sp. HG99]